MDRQMDEIHVLNFLMQLTAALCYLHYDFESYMEAVTSDVGQIPGWETVVHTDIRLEKSSFRRRCTSGFRRKLGGFGLAMPLKAGVLVTTHWAGSLAGGMRGCQQSGSLLRSLPFRFETELFLKPHCRSDMGHQT